MIAELEPLCRGRARVVVEDVDTRPDWAEAYGLRVPVLCSDGQEICHFELDRARVAQLLAADRAGRS